MRAAALAILAAAIPARADGPSPSPSASPSPSPANVAAARRHFDKARGYYEQGQYREAIGELDTAHTLDPSAKDLVFNLGVVHEKLGDIDEALQWFKQYASMNLTPQESDRAEAYVRRLEGARREVEGAHEGPAHKTTTATAPEAPPSERPEAQAPTVPAPPSSPPDSPPGSSPGPARPAREPSPSPSPWQSRIDAPVIATGVVAGIGLVAGVVLGIKAVADRPGDFVTGRDGSYSDLTGQVNAAHSEAVAADVSFGVAAVAGAACAYLYWLRPHTAAPSRASISAGPLPGGGAVLLRGSL